MDVKCSVQNLLISGGRRSSTVQWLTLSPHRKKLLGLNLLGPSLYGFPGPVSASGCPQNIRVELTGDSKLARDVDVM